MRAAKKASRASKQTVCKHLDCQSSPEIKGYCRRHFLSVLSGRSQGDAKPRAELRSLDPYRSHPGRRLRYMEQALLESTELELESRQGTLSEFDMNHEGLSLDEDLLKKLG